MSDGHEHGNGKAKMSSAWIVAISVLATSGFWNVAHQILINDKVSREEVKRMVTEDTPYMRDKSMIQQTLADLREGQKELKVEMEKLRGEITADRKFKK